MSKTLADRLDDCFPAISPSTPIDLGPATIPSDLATDILVTLRNLPAE